MTRNFFLALEDIADSTAKTIAAQQRSLDTLANTVFDNRLALDYLLAEQGDICAVANTTCCTSWGEGETQLHKVTNQAIWLKG